MAKVLVVAHLGRHFKIFGQYDYQVLINMGFEVHIAANFNDDIDKFDDPNVKKHQIDFVRNPFNKGNIRALKQLEYLFDEIHFDIIHCQSPSGGAVTRLAARKTRQKGSRVIYTAHGLHFFQGAPIINKLLYYNIEKWLGRHTDCIITINNEDYNTAKKSLNIRNVKYIHGVGIDLNRFSQQAIENKMFLRTEYGYTDNDFILIFAGELSYRKHQDLLINTINLVKEYIPNLKLLLAGTGKLREQYTRQVKNLGIGDKVEFLGYRTDIVNLMSLSDVAVSSSRQEGLPVNVMEAMAIGIPLIVTDCRGNRDLVIDGVNGYVVVIEDTKRFAGAIQILYESESLRKQFGEKNIEVIKKYSIENVRREMEEIYTEVLV